MADTQTRVPTHATTAEVKGRLLSDHSALEKLLAELGAVLEDNDSESELCDLWTRFEQNLRDHLDTEERCLFPLVAAAHRSEVEALRAEHRHIRCALGELGVAVDLHALRKASVDELIGYLRQHALREDHSMYDWVDQDPVAHRGLRAMFERRAAARLTATSND
ncbi:MAG TPA: hemerythrin domain-containing protein [Polyangiaceae bacterium]